MQFLSLSLPRTHTHTNTHISSSYLNTHKHSFSLLAPSQLFAHLFTTSNTCESKWEGEGEREWEGVRRKEWGKWGGGSQGGGGRRRESEAKGRRKRGREGEKCTAFNNLFINRLSHIHTRSANVSWRSSSIKNYVTNYCIIRIFLACPSYLQQLIFTYKLTTLLDFIDQVYWRWSSHQDESPWPSMKIGELLL